jgi:hypothetical protein
MVVLLINAKDKKYKHIMRLRNCFTVHTWSHSPHFQVHTIIIHTILNLQQLTAHDNWICHVFQILHGLNRVVSIEYSLGSLRFVSLSPSPSQMAFVAKVSFTAQLHSD